MNIEEEEERKMDEKIHLKKMQTNKIFNKKTTTDLFLTIKNIYVYNKINLWSKFICRVCKQ